MGPIRMVVPRASAPAGSPMAVSAGKAAAHAEVRFLDAEGRPVGRRRRVTVPSAPVLEAPASGGAIVHQPSTPLVEVFTRLPEGAVSFSLQEPGRSPILASILATASPRPTRPKSIRRFGPADARFVLALLAERYDNEAAFHADCQALLAAIAATPPFGDVPGRVAVQALWWKTDPQKGQLGPLQFGTGTDLLFGDRRLAAAFLKKSRVRANRAVVLVNIRRRGGAGGTADLPAWVSNESSATDSWHSVAIHELGHAFGLGDEYDSPNPEAPPGLEPNISQSPHPDLAPWAHLCTVHAPAPTAPFGGGAQLPPGTIGTFQGARYESARFFRPQFACLMRSTRDPFCARCREIIRAKLA